MTTQDNINQQTNEQAKIEHVDATPVRVGAGAQEQVQPVAGRSIHWASMADLEQEMELMKNRQWLSEELITSAQKRWNCARLQAVRQLLGGLDECSA